MQKEVMNVAEMVDSSGIRQRKIRERKRENRIPHSQIDNFRQHTKNQIFRGWKNFNMDTQKEVMSVVEIAYFLVEQDGEEKAYFATRN
jgi:hypothetical protein